MCPKGRGWRLSFTLPCRKMSVICSSGWKCLWPPLRGSLMCSLWSLGSEYSFHSCCDTPNSSYRTFHLNRDAVVNVLNYHNFKTLCAAPPPLCSHISSGVSGWRIVALMCPCCPGRCWCSSAPSCGIAQRTSLLSESTVAAPPTPCSSSSSSS